MPIERSLASDNHAGVHPLVLEALIAANNGAAHAYGDDSYTEAAVEKMRKVFGQSSDIYFVFNGTAANVLALRTIARPHQGILCTQPAHINTDECGAPEALTGCKLLTIPHTDGKITDESLEAAEKIIAANLSMAPHRVEPKVLSFTQTTELGTVYSLAEIRKLVAFARKHSLYLHMDGARIANAAAALGVSLAEMTQGVDVISFGGTKNGLMAAEAVVFLRPVLGKDFGYVRKQAMQLPSKMRFLSAQFDALFTDDLWLKNATNANAMARLLAEELRTVPSVRLLRQVEANAVFAVFPCEILADLQKHTFFYVWDAPTQESRLMTAFNTTETEIREFVAEVSRLSAKPPGYL